MSDFRVDARVAGHELAVEGDRFFVDGRSVGSDDFQAVLRLLQVAALVRVADALEARAGGQGGQTGRPR